MTNSILAADVLAELAPEGIGSDGSSWQARKSAQTRIAVLEAAIDCLGEHGYARVTTQMIAEVAGVSRGAMIHHYATRLDLIAAAINFIFWKRMKVFFEQIDSLTETERIEEQRGLELLWLNLCDREFTAQLELTIAARTDPDLKALWEPRAVKFNRVWSDTIARMFPEWTNSVDRLQLAIDFSQATLEGLLLNRTNIAERERRVAVRRLLAEVINLLRDDAISLSAVRRAPVQPAPLRKPARRSRKSGAAST